MNIFCHKLQFLAENIDWDYHQVCERSLEIGQALRTVKAWILVFRLLHLLKVNVDEVFAHGSLTLFRIWILNFYIANLTNFIVFFIYMLIYSTILFLAFLLISLTKVALDAKQNWLINCKLRMKTPYYYRYILLKCFQLVKNQNMKM